MPVFIHDYFGPGRDAKVVSTKTHELHEDGLDYKEVPLLTGDESRAAEVHGVAFPAAARSGGRPAAGHRRLPQVSRTKDGKLRVRGVASDDGVIRKVVVNGLPATATAANFAEWEIVLDDVKARTRSRPMPRTPPATSRRMLTSWSARTETLSQQVIEARLKQPWHTGE